MLKKAQRGYSRRERQIMDVLYRRGRATAAEVRAGLPDPPGYSSVRALLARLEARGQVRHEQEGPRYVYAPTVTAPQARRAAVRQLVRTFFGGSHERAAAALLEEAEIGKLPEATLDRLRRRIAETGKAGEDV